MSESTRIVHWEHYRGSLGGVWEVWRKDKLKNHYNVPWHQVTVPHCFNAEDAVDPDVVYYQGPGWYRTLIDVENPYPKGRTLLHFEGAGQRTEVYVYTQKVGEHLGGYDEFVVDITEAVPAARELPYYNGRIPIAVMCDNTRDLEMIPSDVSDFNLYGGLYRHVHRRYVPAVSVERVHIDCRVDGGSAAEVRVKTRLYNPTHVHDELSLRVVIYDPSGDELASTEVQKEAWSGMVEIASFTVNEPKLWSPDSPSLYRCTVELSSPHGAMQVTERFGLRYFEFKKHGPFYLNGKRLLLRGTHRHEDFAGLGAAMTDDLIRQEMKMIKDMGANFIRLGHYQQSRLVLDLCDELGLLVWEEIPWCRGGLGGERYRQQARDMLRNMIDQHKNHPSVIIWGLGNENDWEADFEHFDKDEIRSFMKELHDLSHQLDDSRLTGIRRCDFCKDIVDVYSPSIWAGWYRGIYPDYEKSLREARYATDHFVHLEWGADNVAGRLAENPYTGFKEVPRQDDTSERDGDYLLTGGTPRVSMLGDWSESYFCDMIDWYLKVQEQTDWLTGAAQWAFKDFSTPVRPENPIPYMNLKGIVQRDLTKKNAYYVFQSYWTEEPMVHIFGHGMPVRWGDEGERKLVKVYSNCPEAELFLNGKSCGIRKRDPNDFPAAGLRWEVVFAKGENHLRVVARKDGRTVEDELRFIYQTEKWGEPKKIHAVAKPVEDGRVFVEATVHDEHGVLCVDARLFVRFGLAGDGKLLDNLGTIHGSRVVQTVNGRAGIYVDPRGGRSMVSVSIEGLPTAFVEIR